MHDYITLTSSCEDFRDYAMDKEELQRWVMEEWLKHYDPSYLEKESFLVLLAIISFHYTASHAPKISAQLHSNSTDMI